MIESAGPEQLIRAVSKDVANFASEANILLGRFETARKSRVMSVRETSRQLKSLSIRQEGLFEDALECISHGILRSSIVMAWQGYMDSLDAKLASDGLVKVRTARPKWPQSGTIDDLRDGTNEYQRLELARSLGLLDKSSMKSLHGMLSTRNDCAHPSNYVPNLNSALGYVADLIDRVGVLQSKTL